MAKGGINVILHFIYLCSLGGGGNVNFKMLKAINMYTHYVFNLRL